MRDPTFARQLGHAAAMRVGRHADPHAQPDPRPELRGDHGRGLPEQPLPLGALRRSRRAHAASASSARSIRARTRATRSPARLKYYLPYRAAVEGSYRFFTDTWGVDRARTSEVDYTQPVWKRWIFDGRLRYYTQNAADFYSDLFPRQQFANFIARDKELVHASTAITVGIGASYEFTIPRVALGAEEHRERAHRPPDDQLRRFPRRHRHRSRPTASSPAPSRSTSSTRTSSSYSCPSGSELSSRWPVSASLSSRRGID